MKRTDLPQDDATLASAIEATLDPGIFVPYRQTFDFVEELMEVRARLVVLTEGGHALRAVSLLELFIAGCYDKSEELDDSAGIFGELVGDLFCDWIRARQAGGADAKDTAQVLLAWTDADDYGYFHDIETRAVKALDVAGLQAFIETVNARRSATKSTQYAHRRMGEMLKAIHRERGDPDAYAALCEQDGDLAPKDCEELARLYLAANHLEEALAWVDRGLESSAERAWPNQSGWDLPGLRRKVLVRLGHGETALAEAWEAYKKAPSGPAYEELMLFVPEEHRDEWRDRALHNMDAAGLPARVGLLTELREVARLAIEIDDAGDADLMTLSSHTAEPVAEMLVDMHPLLAAKLHEAMALRILDAGKSRYYGAALKHLRHVHDLLTTEERPGEWETLTVRIRERHRRKSSFMPDFERLVAGDSLETISFVARAQNRWRRSGRPEKRS